MSKFFPALLLACLVACVVSIFSMGYSYGQIHFIQGLEVNRIENDALVFATLDGEEYVWSLPIE